MEWDQSLCFLSPFPGAKCSLWPGTFAQSPAQEEAGSVTQGHSGLLPVLDGDGSGPDTQAAVCGRSLLSLRVCSLQSPRVTDRLLGALFT